MLRMNDIVFGYTGVPVLNGIDLTLSPGEFVAFGGRNGSGKTTVTRLLMGLEIPQSGQIFLHDKEITNEPPGKRSRAIGYVFQQPDRQMFRSTVYDEVAFGPEQQGLSEKVVRERVEAALRSCRLAELADQYPYSLNRGEKQRVAIASALAMHTQYIILDEPTSGQDGGDRDTLLALLAELRSQGIGVLFVTHDMEIMAAHCDRAIILGNGKIVFDGTPERLFTKETRLEEWGLVRPLSVSLGLALPGAPYCPRMEEVTKRLLQGGLV